MANVFKIVRQYQFAGEMTAIESSINICGSAAPIYSRVLGNDKVPVSDVHHKNALGPISVTPSGIVIEPVRFIQLRKAHSPIPLRLSGRTRRKSDVFR